jgi:hypothetical protein
MWTCANGREVLFNRFYVPIAERPSSTAPAVAADPFEWVRWRRQEHYFHDGSFRSPYRAKDHAQVERRYGGVGVAQAGPPPR